MGRPVSGIRPSNVLKNYQSPIQIDISKRNDYGGQGVYRKKNIISDRYDILGKKPVSRVGGVPSYKIGKNYRRNVI